MKSFLIIFFLMTLSACSSLVANQDSIQTLANPYWPMANRAAGNVLALDDAKLLKEGEGANAFWLTWALVSPESKYQGQTAVREKLIRVWNAITERLRKSDTMEEKKDGNFWNQMPLLESLHWLNGAQGIPAEKLAVWKAALQPDIERTWREYGHKSDTNWATQAALDYPNADAQHAAVMMAASLVYGEEKYRVNAEKFVQAMKKHLRPPGAWRYYLNSVPIPLYHGFELIFLGRYYQLSRDPLAAEQIKETVNYYPYTYAPENTVEYSSSPWWKQMWNPVGGPYHAVEFAAWLCGDGRNRWLADLRARTFFPHYWVAYCGEAWDAAGDKRAHPEPFPDRYIVEDPSIDGLRGRFGSFSFVGSRGKNAQSFGGCMVADAGLRNGYDGYLQSARLGVTVPGAESKPYYDSLRLVAEPKDEPVTGGQVLGDGFAAMAAVYEPRLQTRAEGHEGDWQVLERWLFTPDGVVAIFEITALQNHPAGQPEGFIRLGPMDRPHQLDHQSFQVGNLHGRLLMSEGFRAEAGEGAPDQHGKESRFEIRLKLAVNPGEILKGQRWAYAVYFGPTADENTSLRLQEGIARISLGSSEYELAYAELHGLRASIVQ